MHPVLFRHPWGEAQSYGTLILVGVLLTMVGVRYDLRRRGLGAPTPGTLLLDLYLALAAGVIVGGRLLFVLTTPERYLRDPLAAFAIAPTGFVFFGSLAGMVVAVFVLCRIRRLPAGPMFDVVATWTPIAHAFGRLGCFAAGCCYGAPTDLPWGVSFPPDAIVFEDPRIPHAGPSTTVPLHPVQLYEAALLLGIAAGLVVRRLRGVPPPWSQAALYGAAYGFGRFLLEFLRGDADRRFLAEVRLPALARILHVPEDAPLLLSTSQAVGLAVGIGAASIYVHVQRRRARA
ncbi:MAG: prolipoprotein diacylglyceryl transferase [Deltaproteobacteria bacterium]|nr:MAG: prolipoprotein diacylglyceryl transferase [Deltaproteobacteria bacterium]